MKTERLGFLAALLLAAWNAFASLWAPLPHLPVAIYFALVAASIHRAGTAWPAFGGSALAVVMGFCLASQSIPLAWTSALATLTIYLLSAWALWRAGSRLSHAGSTLIWFLPVPCTLLFYGLFTAYSMPTSSMEQTLLAGDQILVRRFRVNPPVRGEVVLYRQDSNLYVKRVVAIPGDTVQIANRELVVNGEKMKEPYVIHVAPFGISLPVRDEFPAPVGEPIHYPEWAKKVDEMIAAGVVRVPPNQYFILGDNRDNSLDSRFYGFIPTEDIVGAPLIIILSAPKGNDNLASPPLLNPTKLRLGRTFHRVQ